MGEPAATYSQELKFVYNDFQTKSRALFVDIHEGKQHFLLLTFNEQGVLSDFRVESAERKSSGCIDSGWCASQEWAFRWADESKNLKAQQHSNEEGREQIKKRRLILSGPMRKVPES